MTDFAAMNDPTPYFATIRPARSTVEVARSSHVRVEIDLIALL